MNIYHISSWDLLSSLEEGDTFTLKPGTQNAEGIGVYFSQGEVRPTAAEGAHLRGISAVVEISPENSSSFWRTKSSIARKRGRPRTWHTQGKSVRCEVAERKEISINGDLFPLLCCSFSLV